MVLYYYNKIKNPWRIEMNNIKTLKMAALIFAVLTICGAIYVLSTNGEASPGYAVIPMVFSLIFSLTAHRIKKRAIKKQ